ncbi:AAA family ATPase [Curtobacterium flaccumfaciens]|uniref:AAA family ATPase n=1 Tax=Curtobacterium flaccumfaciens TaxID=2035 RepID=UPI0022098419|nr:AAA family ATPase [Curtobacterium flaccumfaciens]UWD83464.1 AAA family ATPase [Curtobacterium flaccumfaciens]
MRWGIRDFKGLGHAELNLSPGVLTILTGVNSSGKSSAIQSLLMTAQSRYHDGPVVLNGPLVRLGAASDLIRSQSPDQSVRVELTGSNGGGLPEGLRIVLDLVASKDDAVLAVSQIEIVRLDFGVFEAHMRLNRNYSRSNDMDVVAEALADWGTTDLLHLKSALPPEPRLLRTYLGMSGLTPVGLVQVVDPAEIVKQYTKAIETVLDESVMNPTGARADRSFPSDFSIGAIIQEFVRLIELGMEEAPSVLAEALTSLLVARNGNPYRFEQAWRALGDEDKASAIALAAEIRSRRTYVHVPIGPRSTMSRRMDGAGVLESKMKNTLEDTLQALRLLVEAMESIANRVQYLGPLRDEPRVVWNQWNELARGLPVGTRGEFSAVLLSRAGDDVRRYRLPNGESTVGTLAQGVDTWLAYLDIGENVSVENQGKLGIGMKVRLAGEERDLTAVGVGVSQALPLVVAVLASPERSIFIVEQPELHLHPAVQSRLADFLLTARPDLNIIVETHSEALVTRLRRRVAEGLIDTSRVTVAFVEPAEGGAYSRDLIISEYGDLSEWPTGFLSDIEEDATAIVQANLRRIRSVAAE